MTLDPEPGADAVRAPSSIRSILGILLFIVLIALFFLAFRRSPPDALRRLREARPVPVILGVAVYGLAFLTRAVRLNLLLPEGERLPLLRAASLSAAATFLLQVIPFRGGEIAGWAAYRKALGLGWARAGAVFALVKMIDSVGVLLVGLGGAAVLASHHGALVLGRGTGLLVACGAVALLLLPGPAGKLLLRFSTNMKENGRARRALSEIARTLVEAAARKLRYMGAVLGALVFLALYLAAMVLVCEGLGVPASIAGLAFAALTAISTAAILPSPAGTFGPNESGFAAGLAFDGVTLGTGVLTGALLHVLFTATAGLAGLPFLLSGARGEKARQTNGR